MWTILSSGTKLRSAFGEGYHVSIYIHQTSDVDVLTITMILVSNQPLVMQRSLNQFHASAYQCENSVPSNKLYNILITYYSNYYHPSRPLQLCDLHRHLFVGFDQSFFVCLFSFRLYGFLLVCSSVSVPGSTVAVVAAAPSNTHTYTQLMSRT